MKPNRPGRGKKPKGPRSPHKVFTALALVAGLGLLYGWNSVFLAPKGRERTAARIKLAEARSQEQDLRGQLAQLKKLAAETESRQADLARFGRLIPADPDIDGAILTLYDTANRAGVAWSSFSPSPPAAGAAGAPATLAIAMHIGGSFAQIFDYLSLLQTLDRLVVVDSLSLAGGSSANGQMTLSADIRGRMFAVGTTTATTTAAPASSPPASAPAPASLLAKAGG